MNANWFLYFSKPQSKVLLNCCIFSVLNLFTYRTDLAIPHMRIVATRGQTTHTSYCPRMRSAATRSQTTHTFYCPEMRSKATRGQNTSVHHHTAFECGVQQHAVKLPIPFTDLKYGV